MTATLRSIRERPEVTSRYKSPDPKEQLSARVRGSVLARLDAVVRIWKKRAEVRGESVAEIDRTYVVDALLDAACDEELEEFGGLPVTEEQWKTTENLVRKALGHK